jgi:hypothetical protein
VIDKIIITNKSALVRKYGLAGHKAIVAEVDKMIKSDSSRGLVTNLIYLDESKAMNKAGGKPVNRANNAKQNKQAIDALCHHFEPAYLVILGAVDVVPHQDLKNPAYSPGGDDDKYAYGDLPYACDGIYSSDCAKFIGPSRVVGRVPDLVGATEPSLLIQALRVASTYKSLRRDGFSRYFGLSAKVWNVSTRMSIEKIFGSASKLLLVPPSGPGFSKNSLAPLAHFINCHGAPATPEFYGQQGNNYPIALTTRGLSGKVKPGSIVAAECCYGAQLYDSVALRKDIPICQDYLRQGAYGFFGSTTIAYGPADSNGAADILCQYFMLNVLNGASLGRAALLARQQFVAATGQMDAIDLKTLAQFCLLGDPSIQPVISTTTVKAAKGVALSGAKRFQRRERRASMKRQGDFLLQTKPTAAKAIKQARVNDKTRNELASIGRSAGLKGKLRFRTFGVTRPMGMKSKTLDAGAVPSRYHIAISTPDLKSSKGVQGGIAVVAKELKGSIIGYRIYHQR